MNHMKIAILGAFTVMSLGLASPGFAEEGGCGIKDCTPPPPPPPPPVEERVKGNNGLGNGDQPAPGNSRFNNGAENSDSGPHPSGKTQVPD